MAASGVGRGNLMRAGVARAVGVALALALALPTSTPAIAAATYTGLYLDGEPGEYVSHGNQLAFIAPAFTLTPGPRARATIS